MPERPDFSVLFAADLEPEQLEFTSAGRECFVELRPMDANAYAKYVSGSRRMWVDPDERAGERVQIETDLAAEELDLLLGTVVDFCFCRARRSTTGEETVEETRGRINGAEMAASQRAEVFAGLTREFREWLVAQCRRVNGLAPDPLAAGAAGGQRTSRCS